MSSPADEIAQGCCGGLCLCCTGALSTWCWTKPYGSGDNSTKPAGCCGSCCNKSFDEDAFEEADRKRAAATTTTTANTSQQPAAGESMTVPEKQP